MIGPDTKFAVKSVSKGGCSMRSLFLRATFLLTMCLCLAGCVSTPEAERNADLPDDQGRVLVVNTNSAVERYFAVQQSYINTLKDIEIFVVDLKEDRHPTETLQDLLNQQSFDAVYAIGAKALGAIDYLDPDVPIIFSSVLNWRRFENQKNIYGVASEIAPEARLTWMKYFFPTIMKVGVLYSNENRALILEAVKAASGMNIELVAVNTKTSSEVTAVAESLLGKVDVLWIIPDPVVMSSPSDTQSLLVLAEQYRKPVFAYNDFFMDLGALFAVSADVATTGRQAALMTHKVLHRGLRGQSIQFPAGSDISLNIGKVEDYSLPLNESALDSVSRFVGAGNLLEPE